MFHRTAEGRTPSADEAFPAGRRRRGAGAPGTLPAGAPAR